ncbi:MAG: hypothetical protein LBU16_05005 [Treponema sp.]|jgi:hypothetical protein|nr:hypothetical protein [Treponema sp.]
MSKELTEEAILNLSKICKGGKEDVLDTVNRHGGDIIKKEVDKYGNIKYYFTEHDYLYYDFLRAEMALEDNSDND